MHFLGVGFTLAVQSALQVLPAVTQVDGLPPAKVTKIAYQQKQNLDHENLKLSKV